jgi:ubiquinone/menaquinone biosynthesis C-methylase UbiE
MISLDIGCGRQKHPQALYGVDRLALPGVDYVCDFETDRLPFDDSSVDAIYSSHTLEHVANLEHLLCEIHRVAKPGALIEIVVPHFSNTLAHSDYTHKRFFGYYTFDYFSAHKDRRWKVPNYSDLRFSIVRKRLGFRNWSALGPVVERVFNHPALAYIYEAKLAWLIPCFEICFILRADKPL